MRNPRQTRTTGMILTLVFVLGICLMAAGSIGLVYIHKKSKDYLPARAKIEEIRKLEWESSTHREKRGTHTGYQVIVTYKVQDKMYRNRLNSYSSSMREGDEVTIHYHFQHPDQLLSVELYTFISGVCIGTGILVILLGFLIRILILPRMIS